MKQWLGTREARRRLLVASLSLAVLVTAVVVILSRPDSKSPAQLALTSPSPSASSSEPSTSASPEPTASPDTVLPTANVQTPSPSAAVHTPPTGEPFTPIPIPSGDDPPTRFVSVDGESDADTHRVTLRSARDGAAIRVLAGKGGDLVARGVTAAADGASVYFARWEPSRCAGSGEEGNQAWDVVRVPVSGGSSETITEGSWPEASPDGRYLAYAAPSERCATHGVLAVRDLHTGVVRSIEMSEHGGSFERPSWSPDSTRLLAFHDGEPGTGHVVVDVTGADLIAKHVDLDRISNPVLVDRDVVAGRAGFDDGGYIVRADRDSGTVIRRLFGAGNQVHALTADRSGRFVLLVDNFDVASRTAWGGQSDGRTPIGDFPSWDLAWVPD